MMKKLYCLYLTVLTVFSMSVAQGQVGINTVTPQATIQIEGSPSDPSILDGIIPPRLSGDELHSKTYTNAQNGAIVFVTNKATSPSGQTINVRSLGYYYFNASLDQWVSFSAKTAQKNIFTNNNDPNVAAIFDDVLPVVSHDSSLTANDQYTYYGIDGSVWVWDGSAYISYNIDANLNVGQMISVYKTMDKAAANDTHLPASGLIELDGLIRVGLMRDNDTFYKPYIENISSNAFKVTFVSGFRGQTSEHRNKVQIEILPGDNQGIDNNDVTYWSTSSTEILTGDVILPNGKWYQIEWMAYEANSLKHIYMAVTRKF